MQNLALLEPVDYLVIGHLARDLTPAGPRLGGTAAYSALTARALGLRVGVVTACAANVSLQALDDATVVSVPSQTTTTFENIQPNGQRQQTLHERAEALPFDVIPQAWRAASIIHLGPIAGEVAPFLPAGFAPTILGLTPQGWLRTWDENGRVSACKWEQATQALSQAGAAVISIEDVRGDEHQIEAMALACRILAVTEGPAGARLYWNGDSRRFRAPQIQEVDPTGAGDIFAAAFFIRLYITRDPWEAARFAVQLASLSVRRSGLAGVPTREDVQTCMVEVL